jgi:hypothetical protein
VRHNHKKGSMQGIAITDSQNVQVHTCLDTLVHETKIKLALGTLRCQWCAGLCYDQLQLCALCSEVFCVKELCL